MPICEEGFIIFSVSFFGPAGRTFQFLVPQAGGGRTSRQELLNLQMHIRGFGNHVLRGQHWRSTKSLIVIYF